MSAQLSNIYMRTRTHEFLKAGGQELHLLPIAISWRGHKNVNMMEKNKSAKQKA